MSSILTNNGAMVALQTLKGINASMAKTQNAISTGKNVATAKDNAAVWAISKVMEADVKGFKGISDSLALGESTVAVARNASESVTDLLTDIKGKIVASQEKNVDRGKIQNDIAALRDQINSVVNAAQFNGLNLVKGTEDVSVLSSLDRAENGTVSAGQITVSRQDLSMDKGTLGTGASLAANATTSNATVANTARTGTMTVTDGTGTWAANDSYTYNISIAGKSTSFTTTLTAATAPTAGEQSSAIAAAINAMKLDGISADGTTTAGTVTISSTRAFEEVAFSATSSDTGAGALAAPTSAGTPIKQRAEKLTFNTNPVTAGDGYEVSVGADKFSYVAGAGETMEDVVKGLRASIDSANNANLKTAVTQDAATGKWSLHVDNDGASVALSVTGKAGGKASGGLFGLDGIDVTKNAANALATIETLIQNSIDSSASFGSVQGRIGIQSDFVGKMVDSLKSGIGAMVDANMEETSARLQALQVQQQLGVQSLSIANQAPQMLLSLFR